MACQDGQKAAGGFGPARPTSEPAHTSSRLYFSRTARLDLYSQQKKVPFFFSSSVRCSVKSSTAPCARATPFTTVTTSSVLGTPDESRTDFRTSQREVSGFRRGTGIKGILATQAVGGYDTEGSACLVFMQGRKYQYGRTFQTPTQFACKSFSRALACSGLISRILAYSGCARQGSFDAS